MIKENSPNSGTDQYALGNDRLQISEYIVTELNGLLTYFTNIDRRIDLLVTLICLLPLYGAEVTGMLYMKSFYIYLVYRWLVMLTAFIIN